MPLIGTFTPITPEALTDAIYTALSSVSAQIESMVKSAAPVYDGPNEETPPGLLRDSLSVATAPTGDGAQLTVNVGAASPLQGSGSATTIDLYYFVTRGTRAHNVAKKDAKALRWWADGGGIHFDSSLAGHEVSGIKKNDFVQDQSDQIIQTVSDAVNAGLASMAS